MKDNKRTIYFMGGTILVGLLLIVFMLFGNDVIKVISPSDGTTIPVDSTVIVQGDTISTNPPIQNSPHHKIQEKIDKLTVQNINPQVYVTITQEISSAEKAGVFPMSIATNLRESLNENYIRLSFNKADNIFAKDPINKTELNDILNHISSLGADRNRIQSYTTKIKQIEYYTQTLPAKVNRFTGRSFNNFNSNEYQSLKSELNNLPNLDPSLKTRASINSAKNLSLNKLSVYYSDYLDYIDALDF